MLKIIVSQSAEWYKICSMSCSYSTPFLEAPFSSLFCFLLAKEKGPEVFCLPVSKTLYSEQKALELIEFSHSLLLFLLLLLHGLRRVAGVLFTALLAQSGTSGFGFPYPRLYPDIGEAKGIALASPIFFILDVSAVSRTTYNCCCWGQCLFCSSPNIFLGDERNP